MSPRLIVSGLGLAAALLACALLDQLCGVFFQLDPRSRAALLPQPRRESPQRVADNREVLGAGATRLGSFPAPPPAIPPQQRSPGPGRYLGTVAVTGLAGKGEARFGRIGPGPLRLYLSSYRSLRKVGGRVLWDVACVIDRFGRRETPGEDRKAGVEGALLLLGDSYVFGSGLRGDQTLAACLGRRLPRRRVYNYGLPALFPGELLERLRLVRGAPEVLERKGTAVYFYADRHIRRNMGTLSELGPRWARASPCYFEDEHGLIVAQRSWAEQRPFWTFLAGLASRSHIFRQLRLDWPRRPSESDYLFEVKLLLQLRAQARRLGCDRFLVVCAPSPEPSDFRSFIPYLERAGLRYIDMSHWRMSRLTRGPAWIPHDGHATAETNRILAQALAGSID